MINKEMVCIVCPMGCHLTATSEGDEIKVTGNTCKRGENYAKSELTCPMRTVTSSVRVTGGDMPLVSVRTEKTVPKTVIEDILKEISAAHVAAPVSVGDTVIDNVCGTGVRLIATRNIRKL